jgi:hypothetical protein
MLDRLSKKDIKKLIKGIRKSIRINTQHQTMIDELTAHFKNTGLEINETQIFCMGLSLLYKKEIK